MLPRCFFGLQQKLTITRDQIHRHPARTGHAFHSNGHASILMARIDSDYDYDFDRVSGDGERFCRSGRGFLGQPRPNPAHSHKHPFGPIGNTWLPGAAYGIDTSVNSIGSTWLGCLRAETDHASAGMAVGPVTRRCLWN